MEMESLPSAQPDAGSELPPSYPSSTAQPAVTISETKPYPTQFGSELPPSYPGSTAILPPTLPSGTTRHTVITSQPQPQRQSPFTEREHIAAERLLVLSVVSCITCFLCGSPLTLACFVPAILLSWKVTRVH